MGRPTALEFDVSRIREDFPLLHRTVNDRPLVYLDNAASAQKPRAVIEAVSRFYSEHSSNVHRGVHHLSMVATRDFEAARDKVRGFLNAASRREIIFTRGTTEAINLVAQSYARPRFGPGDEILLTHMEHHSNIVPWQLVCEQTGAALKVVPMTEEGTLEPGGFERLLSERTGLVAVGQVSNALGTVHPVAGMIEKAHALGVPVLLDGAQAVPHFRVDVQELNCDFYAFSGHKLFGPTGIGVLYGREELLDAMPPYQGGGDMIRSVSFQKTTFNELPQKFEAGTPSVAGAIGLGAAIDYLAALDWPAVEAHERDLLAYATRALGELSGIRLIGTAPEKVGVLSFILEGIHPHDIGTVLDQEGIAIRTGHHCAQPVMDFFGVPATARASFAFYNTRPEIDALVAGLKRTCELFR
ncbi:MAG: aminotransferase class V-fold PLP-dependent enzyme [Planctomycetota bacterium]|jgi:cysteine desulfurase/selenocysteine lyase